jgi:hypothetical protein
MSQTEHFDVLILGSGQGGKLGLSSSDVRGLSAIGFWTAFWEE